jgi:hypothetical protein
MQSVGSRQIPFVTAGQLFFQRTIFDVPVTYKWSKSFLDEVPLAVIASFPQAK